MDSLDPLGHIRIAVSEFEKSREFYTAFFAQLGFKQVSEKGWVSPPQAYPQYTLDYYAVFFSDPDGIELEVAYY